MRNQSRVLNRVGALFLLGVFAFPPPSAQAIGTAPGQICAYIRKVLGDVEIYQISDREILRQLMTAPPKRGPSAFVDAADVERHWVKAEPGQALLIGDEIRTHEGRVSFGLADAVKDSSGGWSAPSEFGLGPNSHVRMTEFSMNFEDARPRRKISGLADLIRGTIEAVFRESLNDYTYGLRGQVSLAHPFGTHFTMTHDPNAGYVSVSVKEGEVVLSSPHDSRIIKAGQTAATVNGKFLDKPVL